MNCYVKCSTLEFGIAEDPLGLALQNYELCSGFKYVSNSAKINIFPKYVSLFPIDAVKNYVQLLVMKMVKKITLLGTLFCIQWLQLLELDLLLY